MINWDANQTKIFDNVNNGNGHTIVSAVPGSGKTTTLCASLNYLPDSFLKTNKVFFTSFNSKIVSEIKNRIPEAVDSGTNHKLGFSAVLVHWGTRFNMQRNCVDSKDNVAFMLAQQEAGRGSTQVLKNNLVKAMDYSKINLSNNHTEILNTCYEYGIDFSGWDEERFVDSVMRMMAATAARPVMYKRKPMISFSDMIWLPFIHNWSPKKYDRIFVDEAQDLSPARTRLLLSALNEGGRFLACGDRFQSIFSFAGADSESIDNLKLTLKALEMPLSVSYRCPSSVVELAKEINPDISSADNANAGTIEKINADELYGKTVSGDVIISRTNYPLVKAWFHYIKLGIKANMMNNEFGDKLLWRVNGWQPTSVQDLISKIEHWRDSTVMRLMELNKPSKFIVDEADCLLAFAHSGKTLRDVFKNIFEFFNYDEKTQISLLTSHKSKGLEFNRTFVLMDTFSQSDSVEEKNVWYVAITRTKDYLGLVEGKLK